MWSMSVLPASVIAAAVGGRSGTVGGPLALTDQLLRNTDRSRIQLDRTRPGGGCGSGLRHLLRGRG